MKDLSKYIAEKLIVNKNYEVEDSSNKIEDILNHYEKKESSSHDSFIFKIVTDDKLNKKIYELLIDDARKISYEDSRLKFGGDDKVVMRVDRDYPKGTIDMYVSGNEGSVIHVYRLRIYCSWCAGTVNYYFSLKEAKRPEDFIGKDDTVFTYQINPDKFLNLARYIVHCDRNMGTKGNKNKMLDTLDRLKDTLVAP